MTIDEDKKKVDDLIKKKLETFSEKSHRNLAKAMISDPRRRMAKATQDPVKKDSAR